MTPNNSSHSYNGFVFVRVFEWIKKNVSLSLIIATIALLISVLSSYKSTLKPFSIKFWQSPIIRIQNKGNFAIYIDLAIQNSSPTSGLITKLMLVLNKFETPEDKYLLLFDGFRNTESVIDSTTKEVTLVSGPSQENLPIFLGPSQWTSKTASFIFTNTIQYPISQGIYVGEILIFVNYEEKSRYSNKFKMEINADNLKMYLDYRDKQSTRLQFIVTTGTNLIESKKLSNEEYLYLKK